MKNTTPSPIEEKDLSHQADELMDGINNTKLAPLLGASTIVHVVVILLLSVANIKMCVKYSTMDVTEAYALNTDAIRAAQLEEKQKALDAKDAARAAADAKAEAEAEKSGVKKGAAKKGKNGKVVPPEYTETKKAPTEPDDTGIGLDELGID